MLWKKRRRHPLSAFSALCFTCGLVLLFANVYMISSGLGGGRRPGEDSQPWSHPDSATLELPISLLLDDVSDVKYKRSMHLVDPKLRKLMENVEDRGQMLYVPMSDLRRSLALSSDCHRHSVNVSELEFLASGWTKAVYRGDLQGPVAIKTVDTTGHDVTHCLHNTPFTSQLCYAQASHKILKEILLLTGLSHPNIIKVCRHVTIMHVVYCMDVNVCSAICSLFHIAELPSLISRLTNLIKLEHCINFVSRSIQLVTPILNIKASILEKTQLYIKCHI